MTKCCGSCNAGKKLTWYVGKYEYIRYCWIRRHPYNINTVCELYTKKECLS